MIKIAKIAEIATISKIATIAATAIIATITKMVKTAKIDKMVNRVAQAIVLSSQTDKFTLATAFSHYFGLKDYKKTKIEFFFAFFHLAQAVQSFTI